jgi:hypothetical protein
MPRRDTSGKIALRDLNGRAEVRVLVQECWEAWAGFFCREQFEVFSSQCSDWKAWQNSLKFSVLSVQIGKHGLSNCQFLCAFGQGAKAMGG